MHLHQSGIWNQSINHPNSFSRPCTPLLFYSYCKLFDSMADNTNGQGLPPAQVNYSEMNEADTAMVIEIATNALRTQDKSERPVYHRDIAQIIKQQLDSTKG
jgi:hypothetical protein